MLNLYFVNRFYAPDSSATSQLLTELTQGLTADFDVSVITSRYGMNEGSDWARSEQIEGVQVYRLRSTRLGRNHLWQKAIDLLSFHLAVSWFLISNIRKGDVVVLKTDPPMLQLLNTALVRFKGGRVINWLQDIYPEIADRLGGTSIPRLLLNGLSRWRDHALNRAEFNIVVSQPMAAYLHARRVRNIKVINNWADPDQIMPIVAADNPLRSEWGLHGKFVVMYSGNFGRVHQFEEICEAIRILASNPAIIFLFIGNGARLREVEDLVGKGRYPNVIFMPFQDKKSLGHSLGAADLHLVSLRPEMEDLVMPSKVYGILAAGRPIAFIGETGSHLATGIANHNAGFSVGYGEGGELAKQIGRISCSSDTCVAMGMNARSWFESDLAVDQAIESWKNVLVDIRGKA